MKIVFKIVIGVVLLVLLFKTCFFLLSVFDILKTKNNELDVNKIDKAYLLGEYEANYENENEKFILKEDNHYDYIYVMKNDTIHNVGEWYYSATPYASIQLLNFPVHLRQNKLFSEDSGNFILSLHLETLLGDELGNLSILVNGGEDEYTFVKIDKSKNKHYFNE